MYALSDCPDKERSNLCCQRGLAVLLSLSVTGGLAGMDPCSLVLRNLSVVSV